MADQVKAPESATGATPPRFAVATATPASRLAAVAGLALVAVLVALPIAVGRGSLQHLFSLLTMLALAQYWNLLAGYAGLVSVGQQAYVGLGGYALFAFVSMAGIDPLLAIALAGAAAGLIAVPTAFIVFRLQGAHFAIGTWVVAEIFRLVLAQVKSLGGGTGTSLPAEAVRGLAGTRWIEALFDVRAATARDILTYWLALLLAVLSLAASYWLLRTRRGLALAAMRDNARAAESVGVDTRRARLVVYLVTAIGTGLTGALIYLHTARISPDAAFSVLDWTAYVIFIVVIGGIGTLEGPITGVIVFFVLQDNFAAFGTWYLMCLGALAIAVMLVAPRGIWGTLAHRYDLHLLPTRRRLVRQDTDAAPPT
ncbi:MAG: branched-chain amino acid ABC transporter permease [Methylobacteriaceae bacterium]|nr:branched-chain amino acid ABC transporter permease [Methylobacteriaceae bacterium]